ncbi:MAG: RraA family protein [Acidobacteriia bacterium]|nr:RraA family protein [Terriglobia bacterium]
MPRRSLRYLAPLLAAITLTYGFQAARKPALSSDPLIAGFQQTTVASAADAVDQIIGRRGFMSHDMRPRIEGKFVGRAATSLMRETTPDKATPQLSAKHSVALIDAAKPGEVGVLVIENGLDVAGLGGLMGTAAKARGMAGIVIDGGVRDLPEVRSLGLPVYARSVVPSSSVGRYATVASQIPVQCAGVEVRPGDVIVAGEDGVVVVPRDKAQEVLKRAQEIDERESKMVPLIQKLKALGKAIEQFNRI